MINNTFKVKPFVKWVGGKRGIMPELIKRIPKDFKQYYEPFVGGGALFFEIHDAVAHSYISDLNVDLIVAYSTIKTRLTELIEALKIHELNHNEEYYYQIRALQDLSRPYKELCQVYIFDENLL